jgi:hypothetical protein
MPNIPKQKTYFKHPQCGYVTSESDWKLKVVYVWKLRGQDISFARCPNCQSDLAVPSLCRCTPVPSAPTPSTK